MDSVEWGEFKIGDLFESSNGDFDIQKNHINNIGNYVITSGLTNNGVLGKTDVKAKIFNNGTITIDMFGFAFYRNYDYKMVTHARVFSLKPKIDISENQGVFLSISLQYLKNYFGYENMCSWSRIKDMIIKLPTKNNEIDFEFMESFVAELEAQRVAELEAYLQASGLDDYELTLDEINLLNWFDKVEWKEYRVDELFEICSYKKRFDANKVNILEKGNHPYVVRMSGNNGQKGYIDEDTIYLNEGNTISFGQDTATMFYQEKPYFTGDKIKILKPKYNAFNKNNAQFILSALRKSFSLFSWGGSSFNVNIISKQLVKLPVKNNEIDFQFMEKIVKIIQKLVIKDVADYADRKLLITKNIIK